MKQDLFITGTDTGVGKTLLSALLVAALRRKYWKPIQTGISEESDRETVLKWARLKVDQTYPEAYAFGPPVSPHLAAERAGTFIDLRRIQRPATDDALIIEGAGGVLVPVNEGAFMLDVIRQLGAPVVIAARTSLGTINHTLLTIAAIRDAGLPLHGVVMIGEENVDNRRAIEKHGRVAVTGFIPWLEPIDRETLIDVFRRHFDARAFA